jgi:hypothetical protein
MAAFGPAGPQASRSSSENRLVRGAEGLTFPPEARREPSVRVTQDRQSSQAASNGARFGKTVSVPSMSEQL